MKQLFTLIILTSLIACQSTEKGEIADVIYTNGQIITMEAEGETVTSVAIKKWKK